MAGTNEDYTQEQVNAEHAVNEHSVEENSDEESQHIESVKTEEKSMPSSQEEETAIKKKYGGLVPKKPPLISKDHERAFFDSADWALGKQGKPKGPLEALRPKLQPTPHQQVRSRRSSYAKAEDGTVVSSEEANE
uniref:TSA: Wollemia nobilis Ref_Wollemi_Transcript_8411_799 transcribed RNA sequence n=1 Tax=Wollemia nobilis TaxID=56998 RepID=A0A0C9RWJ9_9CONI